MKHKLNYYGLSLLMAGAAMFVALPASGQQITGTPGDPSATTTLDGKQIPAPPMPFGGVIKESALESKQWWPPRPVPPSTNGHRGWVSSISMVSWAERPISGRRTCSAIIPRTENASVQWKEEEAPFHTVARLTLLPKSQLPPDAGEAAYFDVTKHASPDSTPIGSINRARQHGEAASRKVRLQADSMGETLRNSSDHSKPLLAQKQ